MNSNQPKYLTMLKVLYNPEAGREEQQSVVKALGFLSETEQVEFSNFQHKVGDLFLTVKSELDQGLDDLADAFPDETDPRKWQGADWVTFYNAIEGHKFEELYTTYAKQEPNLHLMWEEIESRL